MWISGEWCCSILGKWFGSDLGAWGWWGWKQDLGPYLLSFLIFVKCRSLLKSLLNLLQYCFCLMFWFLFFGCEEYRILAPQPGIEPAPTAAAAAAKSLQSCPTLCDPIDGSPPGFPVPGILQARTLEWVSISFSNAWIKVKVKSLSCVWLFATPWTAAHQAPPSMGFSRQ